MIRWTSTLAPMSMPRVGSSRIRTRRLRWPATWPARPSAGCRLTGRATGWSTLVIRTRSSSVNVRADLALRLAPDEQPREQPRQDRQRDVRGDREVEDQARSDGGPRGRTRCRPHRCRRAVEGDRPGRPADPPGVAPVDPEQHLGDLGPARRRRVRRDPRISPARTAKRDVAEGSRRGSGRRPRGAPRRAGLDLREEGHGPADHVADQVGRGQLARRRRDDVPAVAQDRRAGRTGRTPRRADG